MSNENYESDLTYYPEEIDTNDYVEELSQGTYIDENSYDDVYQQEQYIEDVYEVSYEEDYYNNDYIKEPEIILEDVLENETLEPNINVGNAVALRQAQPIVRLVSFNANGGTPTTHRRVNHGTAVGMLPTATRSNHRLVGWFTAQNGGSAINSQTRILSNVVFFARWQSLNATVTFNLNGGSLNSPFQNPRTVRIGTRLGQLPVTTRNGFEHTGWFIGNTQVSINTIINENVIIFARWRQLPRISVTFNLNGGTMPSQIVNPRIVSVGGTIGQLPSPTRNGHRFLGWLLQGTNITVTPNTVVRTNTTLVARWQNDFFAFYGSLGWRYPLTSRHISSGYRLPGRLSHNGIDIVDPRGSGVIEGEPVFAAHSGTVVASGFLDSTGNWVAIMSDVIDPATNAHIVSRYLHLRDRPLVSQGQRIAQGRQIGFVGNTGHSTAAHLHLDFNNRGLHNTPGNATINPQRFFPSVTFTGQVSNVMP